MVGCLAAVSQEHGTDAELAGEIAIETMLGTAKLLSQRKISFLELVDEVATPGGCTEEGIKVLAQSLPQLFEQVFQATIVKEKVIQDKVHEFLKLK